MSNSIKSELLQLWDIQESLLQSYRGIFITAESIFAAVTATLLTIKQPGGSFLIPLVIIGLFINWLWVSLSEGRGNCVQYIQTLIRRVENGNPPDRPFQMFKEFQINESFRLKEMSSSDWCEPMKKRIAMNYVLPFIFYAFWLVISATVGYEIFRTSALEKGVKSPIDLCS